MTVITRFAPSPTGRLHVGNVRTALLNWLVARQAGGRFVLRIDDTDRERSRPEHVVAIEDDLSWLGLAWDDRAVQSERGPIYEAAFDRLREAGLAYPCYETADELAAMRARQRASGKPPVYDRSALALSELDRGKLKHEGRVPYWRFRLPDAPIAWHDAVQGEKRIPTGAVSDPVIRREDASVTYLFASAVDDAAMAVTDVVRGEDHVTNTAAQIAIIRALGKPVPRFAHLPLLLDDQGAGLSKRLGSAGVAAFRERGIEPGALLGVLATLGTGKAPPAVAAPEGLLDGFDLASFGRAPVRFDPDEVRHLNERLVHGLPYEAVRQRVGVDEAFWGDIRANLERPEEAAAWWRLCTEPLEPAIGPDDRAFLDQAADLLPETDPVAPAYDDWIAALKTASNRKGKALFMPLRLALTAREHGPPLPVLLTHMPRSRVLGRLLGRVA
ncbi:glutamate--tRNA ligase [Marinivivus vitaminiproducens]|uniref:glutamate--tRNA ligase n=1 Tax=Marinivivus vitaminiproducens TaxID=3035935 RepID=UPI0027AB2057|nr:glutamate--tRNA ligase [Geminicoccaceae bacterium SCSIO 64248]